MKDKGPRTYRFFLCVLCVLCGLNSTAPVHAQPQSWLDPPLENWNKAGTSLPKAPAGAEPAGDVRDRCDLPDPRTAAGRALAAAGWIPLPHLDRELVNGDVEIVAGMTDVDGMCRPMGFNLFVFAAGRFAGTLSPEAMSSRSDGSAGPVRFVGDAITAEFARYKDEDALCCPSARVTVRYRVERTGAGAVVMPIDVRTTRSY